MQQELVDQHHRQQARPGLARRLAVIMHRIWVDGTEFQWTREVTAA
jgi:transposase